MASEQIGLIVDIDGDIAKGKAKVNELAEYAKKMLGSAFNVGPRGGASGVVPPGAKKAVDDLGNTLEGVGPKAKKGASAAALAFQGILKDVKNVERQIKQLGLADTMLGRKTPTASLRADFERLSTLLGDLRGRANSFYSSMNTGSDAGLARVERLFQVLTRVDSTMNRVGSRFVKEQYGSTPSQLQSASNRLPILSTSTFTKENEDAFSRVRSEIQRMQGFGRELKVKASFDLLGSDGVKQARAEFDKLKKAAGEALSQIPRDATGAAQSIDTVARSVAAVQSQLERLENKANPAKGKSSSTPDPRLADVRAEIQRMQGFNQDLKIWSVTGQFFDEENVNGASIKRAKELFKELKDSASQALKSIPRDAAGADRAIDMLTNSIKSAQFQLDRLDNMGKSQNYQRLGMFRNNSISPIFSIQQAIEDFSYAGMRGAANNIAFFLAEIAPATGVGAGLAGGGILALMTYQIYELGKTMKWWASEADLAAEKAKKLATAFNETSSAARGVIDAMATASSGFATGSLNLPMNEQGSTYAANRRKALMRAMVNQGGISALSGAIQQNPEAFPFGSVGQNLATNPQIAALRAVLNQNQQAQSVVSLAQQNSPSDSFMSWLAPHLLLPDPMALTTGSSREKRHESQEKLRAQLRPILEGLPGGDAVAGIMDAQIPGQFDFEAILKPLRHEYDESKKKLRELETAHDEAMREMGMSSGTAAGEVLSVAQSNDRAADAVMGVVRANADLNAEYERQMGLMKTLEVLKDRDQFRSNAFGAMRSKGRQFMEQAGVPEWVIQNREMALYQRQAEMLMGSANVAGQAGDTRSQIDYLKQIQQLQFEVIGNTDNRAVAERTMENAIQMQHQIEAVILSSQQAGQSEYEMIQQLTSGLVDMRGVLEMMPQINLNALQQASEVAALNAQVRETAALAAAIPPVTPAGAENPIKPTGFFSWLASFAAPGASAPGFGPVVTPARGGGRKAPGFAPGEPALGFQSGGHIPGYGGGDKVPALLEKGEYVIRKDAVASIGLDVLNEMNASPQVRKFSRAGSTRTGYRMVYSTHGQRRPDHRGNSYFKSNRTNQTQWARNHVEADRRQAAAARASEQDRIAANRRVAEQEWLGMDRREGLGPPGTVLGVGTGAAFGGGMMSVPPETRTATGKKKGQPGSPIGRSGPPGYSLRKLPSGAYAGFDANGNELYYGSKKDLQRRSASAASAAPFGRSGLPGYSLRKLPSGAYAGFDANGNELYYGSKKDLRKKSLEAESARVNAPNRMFRMPSVDGEPSDGVYNIGGNENMTLRDWHAGLRQSGMILPQSSGIPFTENRREVAMQNRYAKQEAIFNQRQKLHAQLAEQRRAAQAAGSRSVKARRGWTTNSRYNEMLRAREGRTPQEIYAANNGGNQRWGPNFNDYVSQLFGGGFNPYMGGGFGYPMMPQRNNFGGTGGLGHGLGGYGATGWGNSFGLYDQGGIGMGGRWGGGGYAFDGPGLAQYVQQIQQESQLRRAVRGYNSGGFVTPTGGRRISDSPDVYQEDVPWEYLGGAGFMNPDYNWLSFMRQRNNILAGSLNAAYGGPTDFAGNTLGSFGSFSDGTLKSRFSGGFSSVGTSGGFGSGMGGGGFSSFKKPVRAMTGGYIGGAGVQRFASGGAVRGGTSTNNVNNNFGTVKIEVKNTKQAMEATQGMRRAKASYWAQRG